MPGSSSAQAQPRPGTGPGTSDSGPRLTSRREGSRVNASLKDCRWTAADLSPAFARWIDRAALELALPHCRTLQDTSSILGHIAGQGGSRRLQRALEGSPEPVPAHHSPAHPMSRSLEALLRKGKVSEAGAALTASPIPPSAADVAAVLAGSFRGTAAAVEAPPPTGGPSFAREGVDDWDKHVGTHLERMSSPAFDLAGTTPAHLGLIPLRLLAGLVDDALACRDPSSLSDARLTLIQKASGGWRPIAVGQAISVLTKKVAATTLNRVAQDLLRGRGAYTLKQDGCRRLGDQMTRALDNGFKIVALDIHDAYCQVERSAVIRQVQRDVPLMADFVTAALRPNRVTARCADGSTQSVVCTQGILQGCPMSSTLFSLVLSQITHDVASEVGAGVLGRPFGDSTVLVASYADDIFVAARHEDAAQDFVQRLEARLASVGLRLATHKTRLIGDRPWRLLGVDVQPSPAHKLLGIPIGETAACTALLLERFQEVADFLTAVGSKVDLQAHRLLMVKESGPFSRLIWVLQAVAPPVISNEVKERCRALDRQAIRTILLPERGEDDREKPPFIPIQDHTDKAIDVAAHRLGLFIPLLRHLRWVEDSLVYDRPGRARGEGLLRRDDDLPLPPHFEAQARRLKPLLTRDALCLPDESFAATLFALSGLDGVMRRDRVHCANESHARRAELLFPKHHLVCAGMITPRHNRVRDLLAAILRKHAPSARVSIEQGCDSNGSPVPRQWGTPGSLAPGDVTFTPLGGETVYFDVVVSAVSCRATLSPASSAYLQKVRARLNFLHPRHAGISEQEARRRAPLSTIIYVPVAFSALGAPAPKTVGLLERYLGRPGTKEFCTAAARAIHTIQADVIARARVAHRLATGRPDPDRPDPDRPPAIVPIGRVAGLYCSPYFVPIIQAARLAVAPSPDAPAALMTIIDNACASYTAWAGRQYEPVPTWAELIRRVHAPLLGWPPLSAYIGSDQQEKILGLSATGQLPVDLWPVQAWVSIRPVIDGWRDYVRGTTHRSSPPRPPASPPRRSHGAAGPAADPRRNGGSDASGSRAFKQLV